MMEDQKMESEFELERLDELKASTETARSDGEALNGAHALPTGEEGDWDL